MTSNETSWRFNIHSYDELRIKMFSAYQVRFFVHGNIVGDYFVILFTIAVAVLCTKGSW